MHANHAGTPNPGLRYRGKSRSSAGSRQARTVGMRQKPFSCRRVMRYSVPVVFFRMVNQRYKPMTGRLWQRGLAGLLGLVCCGAASSPGGGVRSEGLLRQGRAAFEDGLLAPAERFFREAMDREFQVSVKAESAWRLAWALHQQGRHQEQLEVLRAHWMVAEQSGKEAVFHYWQAMGLHALGRFEESLAALDAQAAAGGEPAVEALRLRLRILAQQHRHDEAIQLCIAFLKDHPGHEGGPAIRLDWADLLKDSTPEQAIYILAELADEAPQSEEGLQARWRLALLYVERGEWQPALPHLEGLADDPLAERALRAEAGYILADHYLRTEEVQQALATIEQALEHAPNPRLTIKGHLLRSLILIHDGQTDKGSKLLRQWLAVDPHHADAANAALEAARVLLDQGHLEQAAGTYQLYLDAYADHAESGKAWLGKGWALLQSGSPAEAGHDFERAYDLLEDPDLRREALLKASDAAFHAEDFSRAHSLYMRFFSEYPQAPETPRALFQAGQSLVRGDRLNEALETFTTLLTAFPEDVFAERAWYQSGVLHEKRGAWELALQAYTQQKAAFPEGALHARARLARGLVLYRLHRFEEARQAFETLPADAGEWAEQAHFMRIWCLYMLGRDEEAVAGAREFIERHAASDWTPHVLFWLGEYRHNQGNPAAAEQHFAELAERYPGKPLADEALYWAGRAAGAQQDFLRAIDYYEQLVQRYPDSPRVADARFMQGDALSEMGRFDAAILAFEEVIRLFPDSHRADLARGRRGDCHFTLGSDDPRRYEEALQSYQGLLQRPDIPPALRWQARYKMGRCLEKMARADDALHVFMEVVYSFLDERGPHEVDGAVWFTRAAFSAAGIQENRGRWRDALAVYRRVYEARVPAAAEAQQRMQRIRIEHWLRLDG